MVINTLRYLLVLSAICFSTSASSVEINNVLIFSYGKHDAPPHAFISREPPREINAGIMHDLGLEIGKRLGVAVRFVEVPRGRLVSWLTAGKVHAQCEMNPVWIDDHQQLLWTKPIFSSADRFFTADEAGNAIHQYSDLKGIRVGGLRSYTYSAPFTKMVEEGDMVRIDASSASQLHQMLQLKRIEAMLVDEIVGQYLSSTSPYALTGSTLEDARLGRHCTYSKLAPIPFEHFNRAVESMIDDGTVNTIIQSYR